MSNDKHNIEIDLTQVRKSVDEFFMTRVVSILEAAINLDKLKDDVRKALTGTFMKEATITKTIAENCEWAFGMAVRQSIENSEFTNQVKSLTDELLASDEFNAQLKEKIRESLLKRI